MNRRLRAPGRFLPAGRAAAQLRAGPGGEDLIARVVPVPVVDDHDEHLAVVPARAREALRQAVDRDQTVHRARERRADAATRC